MVNLWLRCPGSELWAQLLAGNRVTMAQKRSSVGISAQCLEVEELRNTKEVKRRKEGEETTTSHLSPWFLLPY